MATLPLAAPGVRAVPLSISLALLASLGMGRARAATFERLDVSERSGTYRIEASFFVAAPAQAVVGALLDFDGQNSISPPIREIHTVGTLPDGANVVRVVSEICIGPFCKDVRQLQVVRLVSPRTIRATVVPGAGDLESGTTVVEVLADGGRTRVRIDCTLRPRRKPPSFLPRGWVLNAIRHQARESAEGLEALARKIAARSDSSSRTPAPLGDATLGAGIPTAKGASHGDSRTGEIGVRRSPDGRGAARQRERGRQRSRAEEGGGRGGG